MAFNILEPKYFLEAAEMIPRDTRLLVKRYFPTDCIFHADKVLVEYREFNKVVAPAIVDRSSGMVIERRTYSVKEMEPPKIAPKRAITPDDIKRLSFGENPLDPKTPEERQNKMIADDLIELGEMIDRREEQIAAQLLLTNGFTLDRKSSDGTTVDQYVVKFYEGANPSNVYTPTVKWDDTQNTPNILGDLGAMVEMLAARGLPATEVLVSPDVASIIQNDPTIQNLLDNRRMEIGSIKPEELTDSAFNLGRLNANGRVLDIISYCETYTSDSGTNVPYLPAGTVIVLAPNCGRKCYAAVTQLEQADGQFHTYALDRVPKYTANADGNTRSLELTSRPFLMPLNQDAWIVGSVLTSS